VADGVATALSVPEELRERVAARASERTRVEALAAVALMLLPGALIVYLGFNSGGFFPIAPAIASIVLTQVLVVRIMLARRPFEGFGPASMVAVAGLALLAVMSVASMLWSDAEGRAMTSFEVTLLYLLTLVLFASVRAGSEQLRWLIRGLVIASCAVCFAGLASRVLPNVFPAGPTTSAERLSYPVTYWNAFGLLAALGIVLAFHLTCSLSERRFVRTLAAAAIPPLCAALYFTLSRGPMAAGAVGLLLYVVAARPRGLLTGLAAVAPTSAVATIVAYHAALLNSSSLTTPAAVAQGHHVALVVGICALAAAGLRLLLAFVADARLRELFAVPVLRPAVRRGAIGASIAAAVVALLALDAPHWISRAWRHFIEGGPTASGGELHARLTSLSDDGRTALWKVALHGFESSPLHGHGAGTYQTLWEQGRPSFSFVLDAHSLYLQTMAELGVPGILFLLTSIAAVLVGLSRRTRGVTRTIYGALLASAVVWVLHAGVDWDWQMPVVCIGFFAAAGAGLGPRRGRKGWSWAPSGRTRFALALVCLAAMVAPVLVIGSQGHLDGAKTALYSGHCAKAESQAKQSLGWLGGRPEPHEVIAYCELETGRPHAAITAMREAVKADPHSWEPHYGLAIAQSAVGIDPRPQAREALRLNPLEPLTVEAAHAFDTASRKAWIERSPVIGEAALHSTDMAISPF
jgi:O-Antigen ligase